MIPTPPVVAVAHVPFYSQFADVDSAQWKPKACGVVSLAMVIDYYSSEPVSVNKMLTQAIKSGAYLPSAGWTHQGLINLSTKYGMKGQAYDLSTLSGTAAFTKFKGYLKDGPVIVSVHYKFEPTNPIPHLVVIDGIDKDFVYYNDPAAKNGEKKIAIADFRKAWKQKFIVIRPAKALAVADAEVKTEKGSENLAFFETFLGWFRGDTVA